MKKIKFPIILQDNCEIYKNEIIEKGGTMQIRNISEDLRREYNDLDIQIRQLQVNFKYFKFITSEIIFFFSKDSIEALNRNQQRGLDSLLYNKANELQEDISMKKFDLKAKQLQLAAIRAQVNVFNNFLINVIINSASWYRRKFNIIN